MRKKIIIVAIILLIVALVVGISLYISEKQVRDWVDEHVLRKNITEQDLPVISLNTDKANQVYVYSKYIAVLNNKTIKLYNGFGEEVTSIDIDINTALFDSNKKYLAIAEDGGDKVCLLLDKTYLWSNSIEGEILQVHVNQNGYVVVVTTDSAHKSIVTLLNPSGKKLFKRYFSSTRIIDASISMDNKYIALGELDTTGSNIQSNINIISIENAQTDPENTIIYTYNAESGNLIVNVEYQDKGQIACLYDKTIEIINNEESKELIKSENQVNTFMAINFNNHVVYAEEENSGLFNANTNVKIIDTSNNEEKLLVLEDLAKEINSKDSILEINFGTEMYFYDTNGWLVKRYTSNKEITNVEFSSNLAAIVYKDKVIVINF